MSPKQRKRKQPDRVTFRANLPSEVSTYQHVHVEATVSVAPHEDAEVILDDMKEFVAAELQRAVKGENPRVRRTGRFHDLLG